MGLRTFGLMAVDWEERVDVERLRRDRLQPIKSALKRSELGSLLCFDMNNIRYITATHIGTWAMDKLVRFSLLPQDDEPVLWDFGSAARHHQIYCPWLGERSRAGISTLRGATHPGSGLAEDVAKKVRRELEKRKLENEPVGVDVIEMPVLDNALTAAAVIFTPIMLGLRFGAPLQPQPRGGGRHGERHHRRSGLPLPGAVRHAAVRLRQTAAR